MNHNDGLTGYFPTLHFLVNHKVHYVWSRITGKIIQDPSIR